MVLAFYSNDSYLDWENQDLSFKIFLNLFFKMQSVVDLQYCISGVQQSDSVI